MATLFAVFLTRSSNFDCSHVRVPSASEFAAVSKTKRKKRKLEAIERCETCNVIPLGVMWKLQSITAGAVYRPLAVPVTGVPRALSVRSGESDEGSSCRSGKF